MSLASKHTARFGRRLYRNDSTVFTRNSLNPVAEKHQNFSLTAAIPGAVIFGLIAIGITVWRVRIYLRRKKAAAAAPTLPHLGFIGEEKGSQEVYVNLEGAHNMVEKPSVAHITSDDVSSGHGGWVPQIKSVSSPHPDFPLAAQHPAATQASITDAASTTSPPAAVVHGVDALPPAYRPRRQSTRQSVPATPPSPPPQGTLPAIPTAMAGNANAHPNSPTSSKFADHQQAQPATKPVEPNPRNIQKKFPRLMIVTKTFEPTLADELPINHGEIIRLLEEYEDGWCLAQKVGGKDAKKGAIPRSFLDERASTTSF